MLKPVQSRPTQEIVASLAAEVRRIEGPRLASQDILSSGFTALDRELPEGGFRRGSLVEWLSPPGSGAALLAWSAAREAARDGGALVVVDPRGLFYPPAVGPLGIELARLIVIRPHEEDRAWAFDQVLRSAAVAAVWCVLDEPSHRPADAVSDHTVSDHTLRRWQLAAESSGVLGLLLRSSEARQAPSWADVRLLVEPLSTGQMAAAPSAGRDRRLRVELLRARAGQAGATLELEIPADDERFHSPLATRDEYETRRMHLAPSVASAKARRRSHRA